MTQPEIGSMREPTEEEARFIAFILHGIATWVDYIPTDRSVLIAAISKLSQIVFCEQTPYDLKTQCNEIDVFAKCLKSYALRETLNIEAV